MLGPRPSRAECLPGIFRSASCHDLCCRSPARGIRSEVSENSTFLYDRSLGATCQGRANGPPLPAAYLIGRRCCNERMLSSPTGFKRSQLASWGHLSDSSRLACRKSSPYHQPRSPPTDPRSKTASTFLPDRAMCAERDFVSGFCSSPRISFPSIRRWCRSGASGPLPQTALRSSTNRVTLLPKFDDLGVLDEGLPPGLN